MIGFFLNMSCFSLVHFYFGNSMGGLLPTWFLFYCGLAYFLYHICDNSDGKQARRTNSSSPLGMLLDHGIDAFTIVFFGVVVMRIVSIGIFNIVQSIFLN
jgi:ethanolaminephosphotransferase